MQGGQELIEPSRREVAEVKEMACIREIVLNCQGVFQDVDRGVIIAVNTDVFKSDGVEATRARARRCNERICSEDESVERVDVSRFLINVFEASNGKDIGRIEF